MVAEVWEEWVTPLDSRMEAIGGIVLRQAREGIVDSQIERDIASLKAEIANFEAECARADKETKAKLQAKINNAQDRLKAAQGREGDSRSDKARDGCEN